MDQERVTLVPPGGIERTARSIKYLGGLREWNNMFPKLERYIAKNGTIHCKVEQYKTKSKRNKPILLQRECWEGF